LQPFLEQMKAMDTLAKGLPAIVID